MKKTLKKLVKWLIPITFAFFLIENLLTLYEIRENTYKATQEYRGGQFIARKALEKLIQLETMLEKVYGDIK